MKRFKVIAMRMIPVLAVIILMGILSFFIFSEMLQNEKDNCWEALKMATEDVKKEIEIRFSDTLNYLDLAADAIEVGAGSRRDKAILSYVAVLQKKTIFNRIDVMFPDGSILLQSGEYYSDDGRLTFDELAVKGPHLSVRRTDPLTGREVIYYFTPVITHGAPEAIMIGVIDCEEIGELFVTEHYDSSAQVFLVDRRDGSYLIDRWHDDLGNVKDLGTRELAETYEEVDFVNDILEGKEFEVAFISQTNGKVSYSTYMPVDDFPFSLSLFVQEDIIFKDVLAVRKLFGIAANIEVAIFIVYLIWNIYLVTVSVKNEEKVRAAEVEQEKNIAKSRFLSSVSHDIRTPLNGIIGMLDVIRLRGGVPEHMEDSLHKIDVSAKYLLTLTGNVLDLNEIETGKVVFSSEPIDLRELISDIGIIMEPRAQSNGLSYSSECVLTNPHVLGSEVHINKILINLIGNAIKYNREGGKVNVSISCTDSVNGVADYIFTVSDNGIGMTEEFQKTMFNAFEQEQAGARTAQMGHGIGLSIVKRLVDKMGGTIHVESKRDVGTRFTVTIPLAADEKNEKDAVFSSDIITLDGVRILIAEDNDLNIEIADVILSGAGAVVTKAKNGREAVDIFNSSNENEFNCILMDIMMPEMDGYEATLAIRALERKDARTVPIIAMTASTFSEDIRHCREVGMNGHIGKPLDMNTVIVKIAKQLERKPKNM